MIKQNKKGDEKMDHKDIWLIMGITIILAVAVSLSTVSITGNAFAWNTAKIQKLPATITPATTDSDVSRTTGKSFSLKVAESMPNIYGKTVSLDAVGSTKTRVSVDGESATISNGNSRVVNGLKIAVSNVIDVGSLKTTSANARSSATFYVTQSSSTTDETLTQVNTKISVPITTENLFTTLRDKCFATSFAKLPGNLKNDPSVGYTCNQLCENSKSICIRASHEYMDFDSQGKRYTVYAGDINCDYPLYAIDSNNAAFKTSTEITYTCTCCNMDYPNI